MIMSTEWAEPNGRAREWKNTVIQDLEVYMSQCTTKPFFAVYSADIALLSVHSSRTHVNNTGGPSHG